jgi:transcriptional regulator with XRE-family HTH domain
MKKKLAPLNRYLKDKRLEAGLTQQELGDFLGYKPQFVANWERGASSPPAKIMGKLIKVLRIPEDEILEILTRQSVDYWRQVICSKKTRRVRA